MRLPVELIRMLFTYDPETGLVKRKITTSSRFRAGDVVGTPTKSGYLRVGILDSEYYLHHLAWVLHYGEWPAPEVDHENRDRADNRILNLRKADRTGQLANSGLSRRSTSGVKGVTFHKRANKWMAQIQVRGVPQYLGLYETKEAAAAAYKAAAIEAFGEFAHIPATAS